MEYGHFCWLLQWNKIFSQNDWTIQTVSGINLNVKDDDDQTKIFDPFSDNHVIREGKTSHWNSPNFSFPLKIAFAALTINRAQGQSAPKMWHFAPQECLDTHGQVYVAFFLTVGNPHNIFVWAEQSHFKDYQGKTGAWEEIYSYQKCSVQRSPYLMSCCHCFVVVLSCCCLFCCCCCCCCCCVIVLLLFHLFHCCFGLFCSGFVLLFFCCCCCRVIVQFGCYSLVVVVCCIVQPSWFHCGCFIGLLLLFVVVVVVVGLCNPHSFIVVVSLVCCCCFIVVCWFVQPSQFHCGCFIGWLLLFHCGCLFVVVV